MFKMLTFPRGANSWEAWGMQIEATLNMAAERGYVVLWSQYDDRTLIVMLVMAAPPRMEVPSEEQAVPTEALAATEEAPGEMSEVRSIVLPSGPVPPGLRVHGA